MGLYSFPLGFTLVIEFGGSHVTGPHTDKTGKDRDMKGRKYGITLYGFGPVR